jgi:CBS domain-containing protein
MLCPRCGHENFQGADRCDNCLEPFRDRDVPQAYIGFQRLLMEEPVSAVESHQPVVVLPSESLSDAVRLMKQSRTGCVLVAHDGKLSGILTERDVLNLIGPGAGFGEMSVEEVMTRSPETVEATDSLRFAVNKMSVGGFRHIPVMEHGRIRGLITARDVLRFLARQIRN